eukprot:1359545-Amorphochlora_amoeboformis.AAC.1
MGSDKYASSSFAILKACANTLRNIHHPKLKVSPGPTVSHMGVKIRAYCARVRTRRKAQEVLGYLEYRFGSKPTKYSLALLSNDKSQSGHSGGTLGLSLLHLLKKVQTISAQRHIFCLTPEHLQHNRQQTVIYVFEWKQAKHSSLVSEVINMGDMPNRSNDVLLQVQNDQHVVHAARALLSKIFAEPSPAEEPSELCALPKPTSETDKLEIAAIQEQALSK